MRWIVVTIMLAGCMDSRTFECGDLICPTNTVCSTDHQTCVSKASIEACVGVGEGERCEGDRGEGTCQDALCVPLSCGDGVVRGLEQCDGANLADKSCATVGFYEDGPLTCLADCSFDYAQCRGFCGDGVIAAGEACDGTVTTTCADLGFYKEGPMSCTPLCTINASGCSERCGDGVINGPEACDGHDPVQQCTSFGFDFGPAICTGNCAAGLAGCGRLGWQTDVIGFRPFSVDLVVFGGSGYVLDQFNGITRFDGVSSQAIDFPPESSNFRAVWGTSSTDLRIVGSDGTIRRFDGAAWTLEVTGPGPLHGIHGVGASQWAVGAGGVIHRFDGSTWQTETSNVLSELRAVFAISTDEVIAVGAAGTIIRYDGTDWQNANTSGVTSDFVDVWASSGTDIYVGGNGTLLHFDGAWSVVPLPLATGSVFVTGTASDNVFAAQMATNGRARIWHFGGADWVELQSPNEDSPGSGMTPIATTSDGQLLVATSTGFLTPFLVRRFQRAGPTTTPGVVPPTTGVWAADRNFIVAVGPSAGVFEPFGKIAMFDGQTWTTAASIVSASIQNVWGLDRSTVFAVGGPDLLLRWNPGQQTWDEEDHGGLDMQLPTAVWGSSSTDLFVTSNRGMFHNAAGGWQHEVQAIALQDVWGTSSTNVYAVGENGTILHYDGLQWQPMSSGIDNAPLLAIWGSSDTDVYAISDSVVLHYDGAGWSQVEIPLGAPLADVSGSGPDDVFIVRGDNQLLHYDGARWAPVNLGLSTQLTELRTVFADRSQWIVGGRLFFAQEQIVRQYVRVAGGGP